MRYLLILLLMVVANTPTFGAPTEPETSTVFAANANGFPAVRIPSLVVTASGTLLAFAEGRRNLSDQAQNKIIQRRSSDGGKTWSETKILADDGNRPLNNPCAVIDSKTGRILLMYQSYPPHLSEFNAGLKTGYEGDEIVKSYIIRSSDEGLNWSAPQEITRQVKRPTKATTLASGPGIGIQLSQGPHAGRLLIPFNEGPPNQWNIYVAYSDDGGATWQTSADVTKGTYTNEKGELVSQVNECQIAELSDGRVYINSRRASGKALRKVSFSSDGGQTWSPVQEDLELTDPTCMASILALPDPAKPRLLYSGPRAKKRENGTIYLSYDNGKTWPVKKVLVPGFFAYSNLVQLKDGSLGCLYEANGYASINFVRFSLDWLTEGADSWAKK